MKKYEKDRLILISFFLIVLNKNEREEYKREIWFKYINQYLKHVIKFYKLVVNKRKNNMN